MAEDIEVPDGLYFTEEHEWAKVEGTNVKVGISDYAQEQLGDLVFIELADVGKEVKQAVSGGTEESEVGTVESIKAVSEVYSPISGEIKEVNEELEEEPELMNTDPYGDGWICIVEASDLEKELDNLMDSEEYREFLESE